MTTYEVTRMKQSRYSMHSARYRVRVTDSGGTFDYEGEQITLPNERREVVVTSDKADHWIPLPDGRPNVGPDEIRAYVQRIHSDIYPQANPTLWERLDVVEDCL